MSSHSYRSRIFSAPQSLPRPPPKEVFPEESLSPSGLQQTTVFWEPNLRFHARAHSCWMVGGRVEVYECKVTHISNPSIAPPHTTYWQHIPSRGSRVSTPDQPSSFSSPQRHGDFHRGHTHSQSDATLHASEPTLAPAHATPYPASQSMPDHFLRGRAHALQRPERASWATYHASGGTGPAQTTPSTYSRPQYEAQAQMGFDPAAGVAPSQSMSGPSYYQSQRAPRYASRVYGAWPNANMDGNANSGQPVESYAQYPHPGQQSYAPVPSRSQERRQ